MKKALFLGALFATMTSLTWAQTDAIKPSTDVDSPEHLYTLKNGNGVLMTSFTSPTQTPANAGKFAFYAEEGKEDAYFIYSVDRQKWVSYTKAGSYDNKVGFAELVDEKTSANAWNAVIVAKDGNDFYQIAPYNTTGVAAKYMNWFQGLGSNPVDNENITVGLWQQGVSQDAGSRWTIAEVQIFTYTVNLGDDESVTINGKTYTNGQTLTVDGQLSPADVTASKKEGKFGTVSVDNDARTISVTYYDLPELRESATYENAWVYPRQQDNVGAAQSEQTDNVYTLYNNVLAASFLKTDKAIYFMGSKAMNLLAGTEPFVIGFGAGDKVAASQMTLNSFTTKDLDANPNAIGGAEHFAGKALEAEYSYIYKEAEIKVIWRAVLRDGSHYLRTEMELTGVGNVDMYDVVAMNYNVDAAAAGSKPATVGNTRGAVLMSNKIFAGLETPTAYNSAGGEVADADKWELKSTPVSEGSLAPAVWTKMEAANVPARVIEVGGNQEYYTYTKEGIALAKNQKVVVTLTYKSGNNRLNLDGVDLLDANGDVVASDYHFGFTGTAKENNVYTFMVPNDGTFSLRAFCDKRENITATFEFKAEVFDAKEGVDLNTDIVNIQGRWSRNTTLAAGQTWKVAAVVGLIAQDGKQDETLINKTQKRRSFLAYSERERAVPWRAFPCYISWYELNIDRNNAAPGSEPSNMQADQVLDILAQWKEHMYDKFGVGPASFIIDDGWDNYGTWTFHTGFPNEMRDIAYEAAQMGNAGCGAWLGPVGGYGQSGTYRRNYWNSENRGGMQLSNPAYYETFLAAAKNLVQNQNKDGQGQFNFFKFDGISAQFSATGPDNGDTGNENAEGIIRLEQYVRENLKEDIFFNTTVGTWASPFWYQITDATWRQENDHGRIGNNTNNRENWITYRDNLVHQNYVTNSPICPINTLMTHGFILSQYGSVSRNMDYEAVLRELRCAFVCGSGMVELYNDYPLMNSINNGQLWADLAECISWQKRNADVLPDAHWVGGSPWTGAKAQVYGWASWNGTKSTLALRNGANDAQTYTFTLREALNIPANVSGSIVLHKSFGVQDALEGLNEGEAIDIDASLTVTLPGSSLFVFDGLDAAQTPVSVTDLVLATEGNATEIEIGSTLVATATVAPAEASFPAVTWTSSNPEVATVRGGLIIGVAEGTATITVTANDGSGVSKSIVISVVPEVLEPYHVNFDKDASPSRTDRWTYKVSLTEEGGEAQEITVAASSGVFKPYLDKTADPELTCHAGENLTVAFTQGAGIWVNAYFYIDLGNDGQFDFNANSTDITGTDVMTYSFYSGDPGDDTSGQNSAGTALSGGSRNTMDCPSFSAPATPGLYRVRFKVDWNSLDPAGQLYVNDANVGLLRNGGCIVDAMLRVGDPTGISNATTTSERKSMYDLSGRRLEKAPAKGVYILNNRKVVK